ncbi:SDR family oxidoreductase [Alcanivorax sp. 1008]|uniref:SDR family oxidoreductase n=1 Tax=Alcanivorax sp. 1008 TaxID=2816853 RepID=UPI001DBE5A13|nr:SDR family oxidoreductase [Alcanivorax sp. 1008]MCC1497119.1 SDR family oxidoreductase [Alcanivorax sp. 1008]
MSELRFDDRVVVVTGAGNGLGKSHALEFARRGARVIVNDLGGSAFGDGASKTAADQVVEEIAAAGGEAVANHDSVTYGDRIIECALDNFGRIDVVINNAGILRDKSFHNMTEEDWDLVYNVHVKGAFKISHAAWPHLREQEYGRLVFTASAAGIYGNFGQANYAMAKLGLHGLAQTLAIEGAKKNIVVNTIAPIAGSRLTATIMPPQILEQLKPEFVTPLLVKLCHENHTDTGGLYEVGAGWAGKLRWERSRGHGFPINSPLSAEQIDGKWAEITDFTDADHPASGQQALMAIMANLQNS